VFLVRKGRNEEKRSLVVASSTSWNKQVLSSVLDKLQRKKDFLQFDSNLERSSVSYRPGIVRGVFEDEKHNLLTCNEVFHGSATQAPISTCLSLTEHGRNIVYLKASIL